MVTSYKDCDDVVDTLPASYGGMIALPFGTIAVNIAEGIERTATADNWLGLFTNFLIDWEKDLYD